MNIVPYNRTLTFFLCRLRDSRFPFALAYHRNHNQSVMYRLIMNTNNKTSNSNNDDNNNDNNPKKAKEKAKK